MKENLRKIRSNRFLGLTAYQIILLVVLVVALFLFSDSSIPKRLKYEAEIRSLESQIESYREQTEIDREKLDELQSNTEDLEKFARENYLMKKETGLNDHPF